MVEEKNVYGSAAQAVPLIVGKTTVYVHTNIEEVLDEETQEPTGIYKYDEVRYGKDEYIQMMATQTQDITANVDFLLLMNQITMSAMMPPTDSTTGEEGSAENVDAPIE